MNIIEDNKKLYKYESFWRPTKNYRFKDYQDKPFPWPQQQKKWQNQQSFVQKIYDTHVFLRRKNKFNRYKLQNYKDCLICGQKNVTTGFFQLGQIRWENGLHHYIDVHNIKPSNEFIDIIFRHQLGPKIISKKITRIDAHVIKKESKQYMKVDRNQILIMDALMKHGSYKRYVDRFNKSFFRYSEHAGLLDFNDNGLEKLIISGNTNYVDENDDEIYMPGDIPDAFDYEYIFHTHPATPKPGGRVNDGVLYEFPSISDMFHFMDHYNDGNTQGSIVIAAEGMYIIRKKKHDNKKIKINENNFYKQTSHVYLDMQKQAIEKYGKKFTSTVFYSQIAQDIHFINEINKIVNKFKMHIDFYARVKDTKGRWIIDTVYLPIYVVEPKKK